MRLSTRWFLVLLTVILLVGAGWSSGHCYAAAATPTPTPPPSPAADLTIVSSPDGRWQALVDAAAGSLALQQPDGQTVSLFPPGSAVNAVEWSPDSQALVIVTAPLTLWRVQTSDPQAQPPQQVFAPPASFGPAQAGQIRFGPWSPNGRYLLFWWGPPGVSTLADGLAVAALDVNAGQVTPLAETALLTPGYQSWAPDSSAVALTAGPGREAQANKWLVIWAAGSGPATPIISQTAQIPGQVVWSPRGDVIAYAAISATLTVTGTEHVAGWDNPRNAGRRIYLLDPATGRTRRLNSTEAFQDAPRWSDDGRTLYYVERQGAKLHLLAADPLTGQAQPLAGGWQPLPEFVGYYGQGDFEALLARRPGGGIQSTPAPDDRWLALFNTANGSLELQPPAGEIVPVFPPGGATGSVTWSPDSRTLLAVRPGAAGGPLEIWQVAVAATPPVTATRLYQAQTAQDDSPQQLVFGPWSPNSRYVLFWEGLLSASILADGLPAAVLEVATGKTSPVADTALLNPHYQSWAPDSSALAITAGGYRSAQVGKWLAVWDAASGQTTPVISQTTQVPGQVNWSPRGDVIAYAAVPAHQTGPAWADTSTFDNPAIAGRRIYLLDPITGQSRRLNPTETFQDGPRWSADGGTLYYVEQQGDQLHLLAADPQTGQAEVIPAASQPLSATVGYYGQFDWAALMGQRPVSLGHDLAGSWVITEYRFGGVSALGPAEAAAWLGRTAELGPDSVTFVGDTCEPAEFQAEMVAAETYFLDGYRIPPATLGITSPEVEVIRTACPGTPFAEFIRLTPATLLINQDGVFFVLEKQ